MGASLDNSVQDGSGAGIYAQRYDDLAHAVGSEFAVNAWSGNAQTHSAVASLANGGSFVVWQSNEQDGDGWGIYAQRFASPANNTPPILARPVKERARSSTS